MSERITLSHRSIILLALATLVGFGGGGWAIMAFVQHRDPIDVVMGSGSWAVQMMAGLLAGSVIGAVAAWIIDRSFMAAIKEKYVRLIGGLISRPLVVVIVSLCAGIGEELFFRGAIQFLLGIPVTAILFVAIHGYLDPRSWRICVYGVTLTLGMLAIGWMAAHMGLIAPMIAHAVIDVILLGKLARDFRELPHAVG